MRYFTGKDLGRVREANAASFKELVDRYLALPVVIPMSRAAFDALPSKEKDKAKAVSYLVPAVFNSSPSPRKTEHAVHCNLIFLDIDPPKDGGPSIASTIVNNLDVAEEQLSPWSFAIYTTARSTPSNPRLRVVVDADNIPLDKYEDAVRTVAKALALPRVTTESMVPVQAMFLPSVFQGADTEDHQPLLSAVTNGRRFTVNDIDEDLAGVATERKGKAGVTPVGDGLDALDFLRKPVDSVTLEDASEMLDNLDPDMEYREWLEVAAALKHQFCGGFEAYELFDTWSSRGSKYAGADETAAKWGSFKVNTNNRLPVTIRTLMHRAAQNGWHNANVREKQFRKLSDWFGTQTPSVLMAEGPARIAACALLTSTEEEALINMLSKALKLAGTGVPASTIRRDVRAAREKMSVKKPESQMVPPWVRGVAYVAATEEFYRHSTGERYGYKSWDSVYGKRLLPTEKQLEDAGVPVNQANLARPFVEASRYALNIVKVPTVWDYTYDPSTTDTLVVNEGKCYVNTYRKCSPHPVPADAEYAGNLFLRHMDLLIKEPEYRRILIDWLAYHVVCPGVKIRWAPLIQGAEGCGKTLLADIMATVLGKAHVKPIGGKDISSGYTEWATGHQLVVLEEVRINGANRYEVMNTFKPLITNSTIPVSQKFENSRHVPNCTNYILLTNHKDSLALDHSSRRYFVLQSSIQTKAQVEKMQRDGHFAALYEMMRQKAGGLRAWFETWAISAEFDPDGSAPTTGYLHDLINDSANEVTAAVRRFITEGDCPLVQADMLSSKTLMELLHDREGLKRISAQHLSHVLRDEGYVQYGRHLIDDERHYLWTHINAPRRDWEAVARHRVEHSLCHLGMEILL